VAGNHPAHHSPLHLAEEPYLQHSPLAWPGVLRRQQVFWGHVLRGKGPTPWATPWSNQNLYQQQKQELKWVSQDCLQYSKNLLLSAHPKDKFQILQ
jgi:hypothetical protein